MKTLLVVAFLIGSISAQASQNEQVEKCIKDFELKVFELKTDAFYDASMNNVDTKKAANASAALGVEVQKSVATFCKTVYSNK